MNKSRKKISKESGYKKVVEKLQLQKEVLQKLLVEIEKDHTSNIKNK